MAAVIPIDTVMEKLKTIPCGWGQLTQKGILQMKSLGENLHQIYQKFLTSILTSKDELHIRSTNMERTSESVMILSSALLPEESKLEINPLPNSSDSLLYYYHPCPSIFDWFSNLHPKIPIVHFQSRCHDLLILS